ncbi:MAG: hypothetical protein ABW101_00020 [Candidatus Thiodiazotropha sp.]
MRRWHIALLILGCGLASSSFAEPTSQNRSNRQMAVTECSDYRERNRLPCFVSRNKCPYGFEVIERYTEGRGAPFVACRDSRHERPAVRDIVRQPPHQREEVVQQFREFVSLVRARQQGHAQPLPERFHQQLDAYFQQVRLDRVSVSVSDALSKGCFTDCQQIYCAAGEPLTHSTEQSGIPYELLLQLAHLERCEVQGGQQRYLQSWLREVPQKTLTTLMAGDAVATDQLQFATYLEGHTNNRAESVCRRVHCVGFGAN